MGVRLSRVGSASAIVAAGANVVACIGVPPIRRRALPLPAVSLAATLLAQGHVESFGEFPKDSRGLPQMAIFFLQLFDGFLAVFQTLDLFLLVGHDSLPAVRGV